MSLNCMGSSSHAWQFRFSRFSWGVLLNSCINKSHLGGRHRGIEVDMSTRSQNQDMLGNPGATRMILLQGWALKFSTTLYNKAIHGNAYRSSLKIGSGCPLPKLWGRVLNCGSLMMYLVANRPPGGSATSGKWTEKPVAGETTLYDLAQSG